MFLLCLFYILISLTKSLEASENIVILHINHEDDQRAENAARTAINYIHNNDSYGMKLDYQYVDVNLTNKKSIVESFCRAYDGVLGAHKPVHLILDTSFNTTINLLVQNISTTLGIPVVSVVTFQELVNFRGSVSVNGYMPHTVLSLQLGKITEQQIIYKPVLIVDRLFNTAIGDIQRAIYRMTIIIFDTNIKPKISELITKGYLHFLFFGQSYNATWFLNHVVENNKSKKYINWYIYTLEEEDLISKYKYSNVMFVNPVIPSSVKKSKYSSLVENVSKKSLKFSIVDIFYFEITFNAFIAIDKLNKDVPLSEHLTYLSCKDEYQQNFVPKGPLPFHRYFEKYKSSELWMTAYLRFLLLMDMKFSFVCHKSGRKDGICYSKKWTMIVPPSEAPPVPFQVRLPKLKILAVLQEPMIYVNYSAPNNMSGFYIDLMDVLVGKYNFTYDLEIATTIGEPINGQWTGGIKDLIHKKADILLGSIPVTTQTEGVIDFTIPVDDFRGFKMLAKRLKSDSDIFRYIQILDGKVWLIFIGTYLLASVILWIFDYWSPLSGRNSGDINRRERQFTLKECLWFCITSLTPQGGGEIPRNLSGKMAAIIWCMIGFIMVSVYTANLAAFMTISKMYSRINTIHDLVHQNHLMFGPHINSSAHKYFRNMKLIEELLYEKWVNLSLKNYDSVYEKAQWAVWSVPVRNRYSRFLKEHEHHLPQSLDEALRKIKESKSGYEGYIYIGEAYDVKFLELTDCDLIITGEEFAKRPHAIGVQKYSPLKKVLNNCIKELRKTNQYEKIMNRWWKENPKIKTCPVEVDGVKVQNVAGLFILLFSGIGIACVALILEYSIHRSRHVTS